MQKEFEKFKDATLFEGMTSIRAILAARMGENPQNDRTISAIYYSAESERKLTRELSWLRHRGREMGFPVLPKAAEEISAMTTGSTHGGIVAECSSRTIPALSPTTSLAERGFYVMLEGIEDPYNFGYALRSLCALGVSGVVLSARNWMSAAGVVARASAGASELLPIYSAEPTAAASIFKAAGYRVVCADTRTELMLPDADLHFPIFLIVGGEKRGISRSLLDECDLAVKIPYGREFNASLSAASAATILGYEIARQNQ